MVHTWEMRTLWRRTGILLAGWQLRDRPAGHRPTGGAERTRTPLRMAKRGGSSGAQEIRCRVLVVGRSAQDACWRTRPAKRIGICAPRRRLVAQEVVSRRQSLPGVVRFGAKISLDGCEKYTPLTMPTTWSGHKLVWKGAKSERSLHGMGQVFLTGPDWAGLGPFKGFCKHIFVVLVPGHRNK